MRRWLSNTRLIAVAILPKNEPVAHTDFKENIRHEPLIDVDKR